MAKAELINIISELLNYDLSEREKELITDVMINLVRQAEKDLCAALADKLADNEGAPLRLVLHLSNQEIDISEKMLKHSPVLKDMDLIYLIKAHSEDHWKAIAGRENLGGNVVNTLAETRNIPTAEILIHNKSVTLTEKSVHIFTEMVTEEESLATPLLMRGEVSEELASKIYRYVGEEVKNYIVSHYNVREDVIKDAMDTIVEEFDQTKNGQFSPTPQMINDAYKMAEKGDLKLKKVLEYLKRGQFQPFIALFSCYCRLPVRTTEEILKQESGQGLAIACKAVDIQRTDFVSIFLLTNKIRHATDKIVNQHELGRALQYYDRIKPHEAKRILQQSRH